MALSILYNTRRRARCFSHVSFRTSLTLGVSDAAKKTAEGSVEPIEVEEDCKADACDVLVEDDASAAPYSLVAFFDAPSTVAACTAVDAVERATGSAAMAMAEAVLGVGKTVEEGVAKDVGVRWGSCSTTTGAGTTSAGDCTAAECDKDAASLSTLLSILLFWFNMIRVASSAVAEASVARCACSSEMVAAAATAAAAAGGGQTGAMAESGLPLVCDTNAETASLVACAVGSDWGKVSPSAAERVRVPGE